MRATAKQYLWAFGFALSLVAATFGLKHWAVSLPVRWLLAAVPLATGLMYVLTFVQDLQNQVDELHLRIYLEAAAVVVCGLFIIMLTYPALQEAGAPAPDSWMVMVITALLLAGGYINAARRYR